MLLRTTVRADDNYYFHSIQEKFNKVYNLFEDATRYAIWLANVNAINAHNLAFSVGQASYSMKQSPLTDRVTQFLFSFENFNSFHPDFTLIIFKNRLQLRCNV